ncbi:Putative pre-16S rRNA nuclease [Buchnera aphidicola (Thelaxes suberi)]|uniref:Holliday junction resolvase RuvX n=1 Tax=Buchnera aphidicola TaxID=9 RepID=UPI003463856C
MQIIMAFDFGTKKIGIAVGQTITRTASYLKSIPAKQGFPEWKLIHKVIIEWQPSSIIVGLPLNYNGDVQHITKKTKKFAIIMQKKFNIPTFLHDERLTTKSAKSYLFHIGGFKNLKKKKIDGLSAVLILESWFSQ